MAKKIKSFEQLDKEIEDLGTVEETIEATPEVKEEKVIEEPKEEIKEEIKEETPEIKEEATEEPVAQVKEEDVSVAEAYTPNLKFSVHDQEYDMDPIFTPMITNKEVEEKFRTLHAKAQGVEVIQKVRDNWKAKTEETQKVVDQYEQIFQKPVQLYQEGKVTEALRGLAKDEDIINAAIEIYNYQEMEPNQKAQIDRQRTLEAQNEQFAQRERTMLNNQATEMGTRVHSEVDFAMQRPDVLDIASKIDDAYGKGYFRNKVLTTGESEWDRGNRLSPIQCVQKTLDEYAPLVKRYVTDTTSTTKTPNTTTVAPKVQTTTIPNLKSSGSAPKKGKISTMDDIDKKLAELASSD